MSTGHDQDAVAARPRADTISRRLRAKLAAVALLDWIRVGLLVAGVLCVLTGLLPAAEAEDSLRRIAPLLLFLGSVIVLAKLARHAQVFDVIATRLAIVGRGNYVALFLLCVAFATATTVFLNLDTTAVLLAPVFLALAPKARIAALPLAMTTIWLANTASLLLPVSNLTNLLAADRVMLAAPDFAARMWAPQLASLAATMVVLWLCYWRRGKRGADRYLPPTPIRVAEPRDRALFWISGVACLLFILAIPFVHESIGYAAAVAALVVVVAFAVLKRDQLKWSLVPWQLLILVTGLFLVVPTVSRHGLAEVMTALIGTDESALGSFRAAAAGAGLSNVVNNLPAYVAGEAVIAPGAHDQLLALLIGTNVGPIITPWASLATLLCLESCRAFGLRVSMGRFVLTGSVLAAVALTAAVGALLLTG
ncbi:Na+/H+ antiporter NhaD [Saccharopolyspora antimicrobica]|uniref:Arsenite efflux membrane protein ArsB n=1 Tax=Saccharopolyspora antimicrobica TaxID=455193 RepID=A0A1I4ZN49_9PSEU|nr:SLC13 family permease [Saccharopolyspora antimicrobica]RKT83472.1 arsenite efflux membrane protein ArsB [Saccharopolyspora antimicrobica]SFN51409.1 Na+/H+ antiporter NhaD [Saccharopolyspora antimicrobica]